MCGDSVKRVALELGGNAPFLVFQVICVLYNINTMYIALYNNTLHCTVQSADLDKAVAGLMAAKFR